MRDRLRRLGRVLLAPFRAVYALAARHWAEGLHASAILAGWVFLTWPVADLLGWRAWAISAGLLLLSLAGWGHLAVVFREGLYRLTRPPKGGDRG